jgi:hypothetical protein
VFVIYQGMKLSRLTEIQKSNASCDFEKQYYICYACAGSKILYASLLYTIKYETHPVHSAFYFLAQ